MNAKAIGHFDLKLEGSLDDVVLRLHDQAMSATQAPETAVQLRMLKALAPAILGWLREEAMRGCRSQDLMLALQSLPVHAAAVALQQIAPSPQVAGQMMQGLRPLFDQTFALTATRLQQIDKEG